MQNLRHHSKLHLARTIAIPNDLFEMSGFGAPGGRPVNSKPTPWVVLWSLRELRSWHSMQTRARKLSSRPRRYDSLRAWSFARAIAGTEWPKGSLLIISSYRRVQRRYDRLSILHQEIERVERWGVQESGEIIFGLQNGQVCWALTSCPISGC